MGYLFNIFYEHPLVSLALLVFAIGMTIDAQRRGVDPYWYWLVWIIPGVGPFLYFFSYPAKEWLHFLGPIFQGGPSLRELRHRARTSPTLANQLALGQALIGRKEYDEALPLLEEALKIEPDHGQVLYGIAVCHARMGRPEQALTYLERILRKDPRWGDDQAACLFVEIHAERSDAETAVAKGRDLVKQAPTLKHKCLLAEILCDKGHGGEARTLLEQALEDHSFLPAPLRRRNRSWAGKAKKILRGIK